MQKQNKTYSVPAKALKSFLKINFLGCHCPSEEIAVFFLTVSIFIFHDRVLYFGVYQAIYNWNFIG